MVSCELVMSTEALVAAVRVRCRGAGLSANEGARRRFGRTLEELTMMETAQLLGALEKRAARLSSSRAAARARDGAASTETEA